MNFLKPNLFRQIVDDEIKQQQAKETASTNGRRYNPFRSNLNTEGITSSAI